MSVGCHQMCQQKQPINGCKEKNIIVEVLQVNPLLQRKMHISKLTHGSYEKLYGQMTHPSPHVRFTLLYCLSLLCAI